MNCWFKYYQLLLMGDLTFDFSFDGLIHLHVWQTNSMYISLSKFVYRIHWIMFMNRTSTWIPSLFVLSSLLYMVIISYAYAIVHVLYLVLSMFEEFAYALMLLTCQFFTGFIKPAVCKLFTYTYPLHIG